MNYEKKIMCAQILVLYSSERVSNNRVNTLQYEQQENASTLKKIKNVP